MYYQTIVIRGISSLRLKLHFCASVLAFRNIIISQIVRISKLTNEISRPYEKALFTKGPWS
jgi:hypothetical protein